jgi:DMSO/TMAO reductase YedYZ molybdopterin-dependent catalytic subunit
MVFDIFGGRQKQDREKFGDRIPPGQKLVENWPVLHYGGIPRIDLSTWTFKVSGLVEEEKSWNWEEFMALPQTTAKNDIHCVTHWTRFDNTWTGVRFKDLLEHVRPLPQAKHVMFHSYGGYTTNVPLEDLLADDDVMFAHSHNGEPLTPEHGWPLRGVVPKLYFWKSAKWVRGIEFMERENPGFWEMYGYHSHGDPWTEERYS